MQTRVETAEKPEASHPRGVRSFAERRCEEGNLLMEGAVRKANVEMFGRSSGGVVGFLLLLLLLPPLPLRRRRQFGAQFGADLWPTPSPVRADLRFPGASVSLRFLFLPLSPLPSL